MIAKLSPLYLGLFCVMSAAGCQKSPEEQLAAELAPLRPPAEARMNALQILAAEMQASPALTEDAVRLPRGTIKFDEPTSYNQVTAGLIYEANLGNVRGPHNLDPQPMTKAGLFGVCGALLDGGGYVADHRKGQVLKNCAQARYVVTVRTTKREKPKVNEEAHTFVPGVHEGEVHVFDLESKKNLGGFRFAETNGDMVETRGISNPTEIDAELSRKVEVAIEKGLDSFASP